jgi:ABC-2 type transport system permease protein
MMAEKVRAAFVVARRDFTAVIFSKTFLLFLLGPLFPIVIGVMAGSIGAQVQKDLDRPEIGVAMEGVQGQALIAARAMADRMAGGVPDFVELKRLVPGERFDGRAALRQGPDRLAAVVTGTLEHPVLTGTPERVDMWQGIVSTFAARARNASRHVPGGAGRSRGDQRRPDAQRPGRDRAGRADAAVPADDAAGGHGPVQPG